MSTADPASPSTSPPAGGDGATRWERWRGVLLALAIARYVIPIAALALIPALFPDRLELLTLLRPGKETLLAVGGIHRTSGGDHPDLWLAFLAFLPLGLVSVWGFFALGRAWQHELEAGEGPDWLTRTVPPATFARLQELLERRGPMFAFVGRVAALPPTIMAAAAGTSTVHTRRYVVADFLGAVASYGLMVSLGWWLGEAYERGGRWFLVAAVVVVFAISTWVSAWLQREPEDDPEE
jgi:membrane protein DedA with SNARE-associated domain